MPAPVQDDGKVDESGLRSFIGCVKYLRRYIKNCGHLCAKLNELLTKLSDKLWGREHQEVFEKLKHEVVSSKGVGRRRR